MKQSDRHVRRSRIQGGVGRREPPFFLVYLESFCNSLWNGIIQLIVLKNLTMMKQNLRECTLSAHFLRPHLSGSAPGVHCYNTDSHCVSYRPLYSAIYLFSPLQLGPCPTGRGHSLPISSPDRLKTRTFLLQRLHYTLSF